MDSSQHLKTLLQVQLASDSSAVLNLPYILGSLNTQCFAPSAHLSNWTTRIHSLMCSKDPGGRWAGLCLAHKTSLYSQNIMIEFAQSWIGIAMPAITKTQSLPTLKAAIRLLQLIFTSATNITEFQRQVSSPNVTKFTTAVIGVAETLPNLEFKVYCMNILTNIIPVYPTAHRASYLALSKLSLRFLDGGTPSPTNQKLLSAASRLYTTLHLTGGKVGASTLWKKTIDETLTFGWTALLSIRTTFPNEARNRIKHAPPLHEDPAIAIPLGIDRLRSCVLILRDMLSAITYRPIQVPVGSLVKFVTALLSCTAEDKVDGFVDSVARSMEVSIVPSIWAYGCQLLSCTAQLAQHHLTPNLTHLVAIITFRLEQNPTSSQRVYFLSSLSDLIGNCLPLDSDLVPTRLVKALLPSLTVILASVPDDVSTDNTPQTSQRGKKRSRNFEGDEVFKLSRKVVCESDADGKAVLAALDVMQQLVQNPNLSPAMQSITGRVLLSIQLTMSRMSPASFSPSLDIYKGVQQKVQAICTKLGSGTTSIMGKSLPLVIKTALPDENPDAFDILLHPRMPPLIRPMPHVEYLSLFHTEESQEERGARENLDLRSLTEPILSHDILMEDSSTKSLITAELLPPELIPKPLSVPYPPKILPEYPLPQNSLPKIDDESMRAVNVIPMLEGHPISISPLIPSQVSKPQLPTSSEPPPFMSIEDDEDDEEMPTIDLDSDSDEEL